MDAHIDMTQEVHDLVERLSRSVAYRAICQGDSSALAKLQREGSVKTTIDLQREVPLGQRQVESLLSFMVSPDTERALENAERDNLVYDALGEHRILGRAKKKSKKSRRIDY